MSRVICQLKQDPTAHKHDALVIPVDTSRSSSETLTYRLLYTVREQLPTWVCGGPWPLCKFLRSEDPGLTMLFAQIWYSALLDRCAFFLVWGYFIIALPVLPPCHKNYKPTGLMEKIFSF